MKRVLFFILTLLAFTGCKKDIEYYFVEVTPSPIVEIPYGEAYHEIFTFSHPVDLSSIYYSENDRTVDRKNILNQYYNPPYGLAWEGVRFHMKDYYTIEIWVDADCRPTTAEGSDFQFNFERFFDEANPAPENYTWESWQTPPIRIIRTQPKEEIPTE